MKSVQDAFARVRAEFLAMPGVRLTSDQVERLFGLDCVLCEIVLEHLVASRFLRIGPNGTYALST